MADPPIQNINELLIPSVSPQNLERGDLWFAENTSEIKKAHGTNPWWRNNVLFVEKDQELKLSEFSRRLSELGYERAQSVRGRGLYAVRGGIIEIWPIQSPNPYLIEFAGNAIGEIHARPDTEEKIPLRKSSSQSIESLLVGSFVVHVDHGIGIYRGVATDNQTQNSDSSSAVIPAQAGIQVSALEMSENLDPRVKPEDDNTKRNVFHSYFVVEYAPARNGGAPDRLYVPTNEEDRLGPYIGFETPRIHRLGGSVWQTTKRKVREDAEKMARELLELYARRQNATRPSAHGDAILESQVRESFPFQETDDQLRAEDEILRDLERPQPMDRILCGDVGFGKTEIALRAALRAITSGRQVALLAPTTILVAQHERVWKERIGDLPIRVAMLSRLMTPKEIKKTLQELAAGQIDCIIGTHRLLSKDVEFKNLGLVIIDEEQRFGVRQKERFKELRSEIDILSLSATPIPRTLSLALAKLRDLSVINTPPPQRLPIRTLVLPYSAPTIAQAVWFEVQRGGQVYFLHNRVETIGKTRERLLKMIARRKPTKDAAVPTFGIIHGKMGERELLGVMEAFRKKEIQVLVTTTIIENGVDIASANTLIVDDATRLGLAQAHQLRGRTGRGSDQAFAYFLFKPKHLTDRASERLTVLQEYAELGSGYDIALRDLEIRGAGNILGREQAGAVNKVGFNLYCQMLGEAVEELQRVKK